MKWVVARVDTTWWWFGVAGIALGVGFVWPIFWWLVFLGVALFLLACSRTSSYAAVFWGGWLTGTTKLLFSIGWFWTTYPIVWIDLALGWFELPVIGFYWFTVSAAVGLSFALLANFLYFLKKQWSSWWLHVTPIAWLCAEILGALFFSLFTFGDGGTINTVFSFGMAGYQLAAHPVLLQLAQFGGVYILSLATVSVGVLLYRQCHLLATPRGWHWILGAGAILLGSSFITFPLGETEELSNTVAIVDTQFGGVDYFALSGEAREQVRVTALSEAVSAALATEAAYVVMPEDSRLVSRRLGPRQAFAEWRRLIGATDTVVIEAGRVPTSLSTNALRSMIYDPLTNSGFAVDKQFLVPQGEYMPQFYLSILSLLGMSEAVAQIKTKLTYQPGPYDSQGMFPAHVPGVLFCFEDADPLAVRRLLKERTAPFIAHPISHAWFHNPQSLWYQFDTMLKVQAVWNGVTIISAGNMVTGAKYSPRGLKEVPTSVAEGRWWTVRTTSW